MRDGLSFAAATRELLRERLLDAADELLGDQAWNDVTMAAIARGAGVSRQTLYNEFGSRQEFAEAYIERLLDRFLALVEGAVRANHDDPHAAIAAAFRVFLESAAHNPLVRAVVSGDDADGLLQLVVVRGEGVLQRATERLSALILEGWPTLPADAAQLGSESLVRLAISHATLPTAEPVDAADAVADLLAPFLVGRLLDARGRTAA